MCYNKEKEVILMKKEKEKRSGGIGANVLMIGIGAICGVVMSILLDGMFEGAGFLLGLLVELIIFIITYYFQLIIHEAGHLVAGLISGYEFSSFRIGNVMFVKSNGKLQVKNHSVAGTAGQCLMLPPPMVDGKYPVILYNLGGVIMNLISTALFVLLAFFFGSSVDGGIVYYLLYAFCVLMALSGLITALTNGIPLKLGMVNNDGSNARELYKNEEAMRVFHNQFMTVSRIADGVPLRDMPTEWFFMPSKEGLKNSITVSGAVFRENRLMDERDFDGALALIDELLYSDTAIIGLHRSLLICDKITIQLLQDKDTEQIESLYSQKEFQLFLKQMQNNISVIRAEYAYFLLYKCDEKRANELMSHFEKCAATHPYAVETEGERELISLINGKKSDE